ncbi:hypothetical protein B296_00050605 [Ensete ventricosum]|uniref:ACT domain-containing protein ACR n=1 Tax=Ensete ventricosum TaxID=4639 RepID=A0A426XC54_ENSVE|nr:hypothetical protein B296_00050605 [Ensete ventricosum]
MKPAACCQKKPGTQTHHISTASSPPATPTVATDLHIHPAVMRHGRPPPLPFLEVEKEREREKGAIGCRKERGHQRSGRAVGEGEELWRRSDGMERGGAEKAAEMEWPAYLNEYEKLVIRMNNPRVVIDNAVCPTATLVKLYLTGVMAINPKVDSARKHGILLEAVQVLTDLNLSVKKAYISSDGRWFMDVFHVTDQFGRKLADDSVISYLEQSLDTEDHGLRRSCAEEGLATLELTGADRPGLLSEVFAVLADLGCGVVEAKVWTHNGRMACLVSVKDERSGSPTDADARRIHHIESRLRHVLKCDHGVCGARTAVSSMAVAHTDRRLHQMMFADRDYDRTSPSPPSVSVQNWVERGYSVVTVQCRDRPKLLFDIVCTLTDMEYVVFHGTIDTDGDLAHQGVRLELRIEDKPGLLSEVTRTFRENSLLVTRAEVSTKGDMASNVFYVTDAAGRPADPKAIDAVRLRIGPDCLTVKEELRPQFRRKAAAADDDQGGGGVGIGLFYLGNLFRRNLYNLGLIKSCS